jgi:3-isopropylmalate/(R)-2-methylmalate dehydratase small subunit
MRPFTTLTARAVVLPRRDIDTDQIIPARFLTTIDKQGLGDQLFHDWRHRPDGALDPDFPLNRPEAAGCQVLVAGANFGCGSSREHAPWALLGWGLRAVVSTRFADIFRGNALANGLLPVELDAAAVERLIAAGTGAEVAIDLPEQLLVLPGGEPARFPIEPFAKRCLLEGSDPLAYLLRRADEIARFEEARGR